MATEANRAERFRPLPSLQHAQSRTLQKANNSSTMKAYFGLASAVLAFAMGCGTVVDGKCVMRGICDKDDTRGLCVYDGEPQVFDDPEAVATMDTLCGDVFLNSSQPFCCTAEQVEDFSENLESAKVIGLDNCPACSFNFRRLVCHLACSPNQSQFLRVVDSAVKEDEKPYVTHVNYYVTPRYAQGLFDSCADAKSRVASIALLNFMCGKWGKNCTSERWLDFLGSTPSAGGLSPFTVTYVQVEDAGVTVDGCNIKPLPVEPQKCNEAQGSSPACSCDHCKAACQ